MLPPNHMNRTIQFDITTDGAGAYSGSQAVGSAGWYTLHALEWVDGDLDNGVDPVLSVTTASGVTTVLWDVDNTDDDAWYYPRAEITLTDTTDHPILYVVAGTLSLVVANGGATKSGKLLVYLSCP